MWVDQMVDHFSTYIYKKRGFFYFSKRIPKQVQQSHGKQRIVFALNTRSRASAIKYAQVICQRLDERWLPMRLDAMGLGNVLAPADWIRSLCAKAPRVFTQLARNPERSVTIGGNNQVFAPIYGAPFVRDLQGGRRYGDIAAF